MAVVGDDLLKEAVAAELVACDAGGRESLPVVEFEDGAGVDQIEDFLRASGAQEPSRYEHQIIAQVWPFGELRYRVGGYDLGCKRQRCSV